MTEEPTEIQVGYNKIIGFNDLDQIYQYMTKQETEADVGIHLTQRDIVWGSKCLRAVTAPGQPPLAIWGDIYTLARQMELERQYTDDEEELDYILSHTLDSYHRNYRYGRWYSVVEPDGELGSAHLISLFPITEEEFESARRNGWEITEEIATRVRAEVHRIRAELNPEGKSDD